VLALDLGEVLIVALRTRRQRWQPPLRRRQLFHDAAARVHHPLPLALALLLHRHELLLFPVVVRQRAVEVTLQLWRQGAAAGGDDAGDDDCSADAPDTDASGGSGSSIEGAVEDRGREGLRGSQGFLE
jgi:hypothetical protein